MSASSVSAEPTWGKASDDGFGDSNNLSISSLMKFGDYLYAGTTNSSGCELWRSENGTSWERANHDGFADANNMVVTSMVVFGDYVYVGTSNNTTGGEILRSSDGMSWNQVNEDGFGNENDFEISSMAVFDGHLYAGTINYNSGGGIWRTSDGTSWNQVLFNGKNNENNYKIDSMAVFNGNLYAGVANDETGARIWRTSGGDAPIGWSEDVYPYGFGNENNYTVSWLGKFLGPFASEKLYAGVNNASSGCQIRERSGGSWPQINNNGFGDENNWFTESFEILNGELYVGTTNISDGGEIWNYNGSTWKQVNPDGFGNKNNTDILSMTTFSSSTSRLYAGTYNNNAAQLWMTPLDTPTLVPMTDPTDTDTFNFEWSDVTGADKYHIQLDNNPEFNSPHPDAFPLQSYYNYTHNYNDGVLYWRVSTVDVFENETNFSDTDNFTFDTQPPSKPNLLSPANNKTTTNHAPTFDWENSTDASSVTYRLVVDNDLNFADSENSIDQSGISENTYTPGSNLSDDNYYWKVRAEDELGHQSDWSSTWHLEIYTASTNHPPNLSSGSVSPNSDNVGSTFTYEVTYKDDDGDEPDYVTVYIDGDSHAMSKISGNPTDGATYKYEWTTSSGDNGSHTYYFKTSDGTDTARLPSAPNTYDGPQVTKSEKHAPTLSSGSVSPDSDNVGSTFTYQVTYQDEDNDAPDSIEVIIDEMVKTMENIEDNSYTEGVVYQYEWTTTSGDVGQHTYYFEASDGTYQARLPETDNYEGPNVTKTSENVDNLNVSGYVKSGGKPVENATVSIGENSTTTDSDGYYMFENLEGNENYVIDVDASGYKSFSENFSLGSQDKTLDNINLQEKGGEPSEGGVNMVLIAAIIIIIVIVVGAVVFLKK